MMKRMLAGLKIVFVDSDPYKNQREMMFDILKNKQLKVYSTSKDGEQHGTHPGMTDQQNDSFMAVHDFFGHFAPNQKAFYKFLSKNGIISTGDQLFKEYRFSRNSFTVRGEMGTFISHSKMIPTDAIPALFTEIIGQICTYFVTGAFTNNKVAIIDGVNFKNIGFFTDSGMEMKKQKYLMMINDPSVDFIPTDIGGLDKSAIRWNLISHGEGKKNKSI